MTERLRCQTLDPTAKALIPAMTGKIISPLSAAKIPFANIIMAAKKHLSPFWTLITCSQRATANKVTKWAYRHIPTGHFAENIPFATIPDQSNSSNDKKENMCKKVFYSQYTKLLWEENCSWWRGIKEFINGKENSVLQVLNSFSTSAHICILNPLM